MKVTSKSYIPWVKVPKMDWVNCRETLAGKAEGNPQPSIRMSLSSMKVQRLIGEQTT